MLVSPMRGGNCGDAIGRGREGKKKSLKSKRLAITRKTAKLVSRFSDRFS